MGSKKLFSKFLIVFLIICALAIISFWHYQKNTRSRASAHSTANTAPAQAETTSTPLSVKVAKATVGDLEKRIKSPAEVFTDKKVVIKAEVQGTLKKLHVQEGKRVQSGEILAELDDTPYRLRVEQEEAARLKALSELLLDKMFEAEAGPKNTEDILNLKKAEEELAKAEKAFKDGLISQTELDRARRNYELALIGSGLKREEIIASSKGLTQAEVNLKIARMELEKTKIKAPFSGLITQVKVTKGETIEAGRELFTLVDISRVQLEAKVLETEVAKVKEGREADVYLSAYPGRVFKGRVVAISPLVNPEEKTCSVFISLDNPTGEIKPGMHAEVQIVSEIFPHRLLVPQSALLVRGGRPLVFVVENELAKWRYVQTGEENEQYVEILEGVKEGEPVIVEGHLTLAHDSPVRIIE
ncbi:MAG: efflux RND transporter periplasmic adaptor subunit [Candidatus Aminicenantes bacterium]|nr:efflux RND transporter periplasmic adaptor subunit [Candidatus Aminicenantes bacterium]